MQEKKQNISPIKSRILEFIAAIGISKREFYEKTGISRGTLESNTSITENIITKFFATYKNVNPMWILTGEGTMSGVLKSHTLSSLHGQTARADRTDTPVPMHGQGDVQPSNLLPISSLKEIAVEHIPINIIAGREEAYKPIPFVGEAAVVGFGNTDFAIKERDVKDYYVIPKFKDSNIDFMIEIHGESMYPTFKSGDVIACTIIRESTFIQWNRVHLVATAEQGILIKRLKKGMTGTTIMLVSDNPDYDPFEVELTSVKGIALVQGLVRLE